MSLSNVGLPVTISVIIDPPRATSCALAKICPNRGLAVEMAQIVREALKYNCTFVSADTDIYGYYENGSWHGIISEIMEGTVTTSLPVFIYNPQRLEVVGFSASIYENYILITRKDNTGSSRLNLINAFGPSVWLTIASLMILAAFIMSDTILFERSDSIFEGAMFPQAYKNSITISYPSFLCFQARFSSLMLPCADR